MSIRNHYRNGMGSMILIGVYGTAVAHARWGIALIAIGLLGYYLDARARSKIGTGSDF